MRILPRVLGWLRGVWGVSPPCHPPVQTPVITVWNPPAVARAAPPDEQVKGIIFALQEEGITGVVPREEFLDRYQEHCWMLGFIPVGTNALCEAMGKACGAKKRVTIKGKKFTGYLIPPPVKPRVQLAVVPSGNNEDVPWPELPKRARTGTSHAQA